MSESVSEADLQEALEVFPFDGCEPGRVDEPHGVPDIDFMCGHIKITRNNDWLAFVQCSQVPQKINIPFFGSEVNSAQIISTVRHINCNQIKPCEFSCQNSALIIVFRHLDTVKHLHRLNFGEQSHSGVPLLYFATIPMLLVVIRNVFVKLLLSYLLDVGLGFVQDQNVWVVVGNELLEGLLLNARIQTVYVPRPD